MTLSRPALFFALVMASPAIAGEPLFYDGYVEKVIDGDTVKVTVPDWPVIFQPMNIRVYGIDTPESKRGRNGAKCDSELARGKGIKALVKQLLPVNSVVHMQWMEKRDKYGRPIMRIFLPDGKNLGRELLRLKDAAEYNGGHKQSWCGITPVVN